MPFTAPADVLRELEKRKEHDPDFAEAFKLNVTGILLDAIADRITLGGNVKIFIFGRDNTGKSVSAQTLAKVILKLFGLAGFEMDPAQDMDFSSRNYSDTNEVFARRIRSPRKAIPVSVIQDENEAMSGHDRLYATQNFFNNMRTIRKLRYNFILCTVDHYKQVLSIGSQLIGLGFIILETIDQDRRAPLEGTNRLIFHSLEGPLGVAYLEHHGDAELIQDYEKQKSEAQEQLTGAGGASSAQSNIMGLAQKIYGATLKEIQAEPLKAMDFSAIAIKLQGEGELAGTTETIKHAAWLAYRILYKPHMPHMKTQPVEASPWTPEILVNGGGVDPEPEPEKLPEDDYQALRQIALEELSKAVPGIKPSIIQEVREYDYPTDALTHEQEWTYREVRQQLNSPLRAESVGKNIRFYKKDAGNRPAEAIGARFIRWKLEHTPNFPTQFTTRSGPGERDISFTLDGKVVASANVKHFLDHVSRTIHVAPEYQDPVHYAVLLQVKPFAIRVYRGTGREYLDVGPRGGSVFDLGWSGFVEDLRREAEKVDTKVR